MQGLQGVFAEAPSGGGSCKTTLLSGEAGIGAPLLAVLWEALLSPLVSGTSGVGG